MLDECGAGGEGNGAELRGVREKEREVIRDRLRDNYLEKDDLSGVFLGIHLVGCNKEDWIGPGGKE